MTSSTTQSHVESFINGNVTSAKNMLKRRSHRELRNAYKDVTMCSDDKAVAFADFIKGDICFQEYCDTPKY